MLCLIMVATPSIKVVLVALKSEEAPQDNPKLVGPRALRASYLSL